MDGYQVRKSCRVRHSEHEGDRTSCRVLALNGELLLHERLHPHLSLDYVEPLERVVGDHAIDCLWVTELQGRVVGMIGLVHCKRHIVRICRFRIDPAWQHTGVLDGLMHSIHDYCCDHGCLKVLVEIGDVPHWVMTALARRGFHFVRRKTHGDRDMLEFYVDLYYRNPEQV